MIDYRWTTFGHVMLLGAVASVSSCGGSDLVLPSDGPAALQPVAGQDQTGTVGVALVDSLVVRVTDAAGAGMAGVSVTWSASGGGSVNPAASITDAEGRVAAQRVLGLSPGAYATTVTAPVAQGSPLVFLATASPGAPNGSRSALDASPNFLTASTGDNSATVTITVRDQHGNPVPDVKVVLSATGSGNGITQPSASTNSAGVATGSFSATAAGVHLISAKAGGVTIDQTAKITVNPAAADGGHSQADVPNGTAGASTIVIVRLRDRFGNAITGARSKLDISVSGANASGSLRIAELEDGEYTANYTPTVAGMDFVRVTLPDATPFGDPFTSIVASGPATPATTIATVEGAATIFEPSVDITVDVRDAFGNPVRRAGENVTVAATHGDERRAVPTSYDSNSGLYVGTFRPWDFGEFGVEIMVNGVPIPGSPFRTVMSAF